MNIPTNEDWRSEPSNLDAQCAYEHFFGKSLKESASLFVDNALYYQEDLMFMPVACFFFYAHAYIDYLVSDQSEGDADGASSLFGLVEVRKGDILRAPPYLRERIRALLQRLANRQAWYDAEPQIYGDFKVKSEAYLSTIEEPNIAPGTYFRKSNTTS